MRILLVLLLSSVYASDVNSFPKLAGNLLPGDVIILGDEPANVTDVSLNDDGTLTVIGMGLFTAEFNEKELDSADVIEISSASISEQKVLSIDENNYIVLQDSEGTVTDDAEIFPSLMDKLKSALKMKEEVKATVVYTFGVRRITRLILP